MACDPSCERCSGPLSTDCIICPPESTNRLDNRHINGSCPCKSKFYPSGLNCLPCHYSCGECTGPLSTQCTVCSIGPTINRYSDVVATSSCPCSPGYFDDSSNLACVKCHYSCKTCSGPTSLLCLSCEVIAISFRVDPGVATPKSCLCTTSFYDDGSNPICQPCHYSCQTCNGPASNQCLSCPIQATYMRSSVTSGANMSCPCDAGYFDNGNQLCATCDSRCLSCFLTA